MWLAPTDGALLNQTAARSTPLQSVVISAPWSVLEFSWSPPTSEDTVPAQKKIYVAHLKRSESNLESNLQIFDPISVKDQREKPTF